MMRIRCSACGKVLSFTAADGGKIILCDACGARMQAPLVEQPPVMPAPRPRETPSAPKPAPQAPLPLKAAGLAATGALLVIITVLSTWAIMRRAQAGHIQQYWSEALPRIVVLKGEAERLALAGKLAEAHALYREIEKMAAGRKMDSAIWDLTERAKQDQDQIYRTMLAEMEGRALAQRQAPPPEKTPASLSRDQNRMPLGSYPAELTRIQPEVPGPTTNPSGRKVVAGAPATRPVEGAAGPLIRQPAPQLAASRPATPPAASGELFEAQVDEAIRKGVDFLLAHQKDGAVQLDKKPSDTFAEGANALCVYALLQAGRAIPDERLKITSPLMRGMLDRVKGHLLDDANPAAPVTYARSLRAAALSVYNRPEDRTTLEKDVAWLIRTAVDGAYTYNDVTGPIEQKKNQPDQNQQEPAEDGQPAPEAARAMQLQPVMLCYGGPEPLPLQLVLHNGELATPALPPPKRRVSPHIVNPLPYETLPPHQRLDETDPPNLPWDNSNTQYGLLGVWCGAEAGIDVPLDYWLKAERHWLNTQLETGQWGYTNDQPMGTYAMTVGGIASLLITHEYLDALAPIQGSRPGEYSPALNVALSWLDRGTNCVEVASGPVQYMGYNLFGLARVGAATGFKHFGGHDWYRELAMRLIASQWPNGAWGRQQEGTDAIIDTAYALLFLSRGRYPVMMNKLRFDGPWSNRPRDLANLTRFTSRELERPVSWQVVDLRRPWADWTDAPVLYIASHQALRFTDEECGKLRSFAEAGGLIFSHADTGNSAFNSSVAALARKLFPAYAYAPLPVNHEIFSLQYQPKGTNLLHGVSNGSRLLLVHSSNDLSTAWQTRDAARRPSFELAVNVFAYATGKADLRNRIASTCLPEPPAAPATTLRLARIRYAGNWNPEPYAWERFPRWLAQAAGIGLDVAEVNCQELKPSAAPLAHLTGTDAWTATDTEAAALRTYVESGGILLIDACGGSSAFTQNATALLTKTFPQARLQAMPDAHRLLTAALPGMKDLSKAQLRLYAQQKKPFAQLQILAAGKGKVILSSLDITSGLLGTNTWGIAGYQPAYAQDLVRNALLWAASGATE